MKEAATSQKMQHHCEKHHQDCRHNQKRHLSFGIAGAIVQFIRHGRGRSLASRAAAAVRVSGFGGLVLGGGWFFMLSYDDLVS
jgi:hypothetical protein